MISTRIQWVRQLALLLLCGTLPFSSYAGEPSYETPPVMKPSEVVPTDVTAVSNLKVDENIVASNYYFYFHITTSDFGNYDVGSVAMLRTRAREVAILAQNPDEGGTGDFADSVKTEVTSNAKGAVNSVISPVKTVKAVATGIKRDSVNAIDFLFRKNRNQPKDAFMIGEARRKLAAAYGLDVYSTNPAVQDFLNSHAKARTAGVTFVSASLSITTTVVPVLSPVGWAITAGKYREQANAKIDTLSALDLYHYNEDVLKDMKVDEDLRQRFLEYPDFTPRQKTEIVAALRTLEKLEDKSAFVAAALTFHPVEGIWPVEGAALLAKFDNKEEPIKSVQASGPALAAKTVGGKDVVVFPADILYWNYDAAKVFESFPAADAGTAPSRICVVSGQITPRAKSEIERRGFAVRANYLAD